MENFWQMLREKRPELTRSGRLVADYLLQNPQGAQNLSISQLAQVCQVAEATIFRFCRALGFEGYHEMKIAIAQANAMVSPLPTRLEPGADTATLYRYASESVVEMLSAIRGALELAAVWVENTDQHRQLVNDYATRAKIYPAQLWRQVRRWFPWLLMLKAGWFEYRWRQTGDQQFIRLADDTWRQLLIKQ